MAIWQVTESERILLKYVQKSGYNNDSAVNNRRCEWT